MNPYELRRPRKFVADDPLSAQLPDTASKTDRIAKDLFGNEISVSESDVYRALSPYGQNIDSVVRAKGIKIYREMCEDDQIKACLEIRKQALLASDWKIEPADDSPMAKMYADFITECLERMDGSFETTLYEIYSAMEFGFSLTEITLKIFEDGEFKGKAGIKSLKTREPYNYDFKTDVFGNVEGLVYIGLHAKLGMLQRDSIPNIQSNNSWPSLAVNIASPLGDEYGTLKNPFPKEKFIIYSYNSQFNNPYGRSDLLACFRPWIYKKFVMRFWIVWLERYAAPFVTATYDQGLGLRRELMDEIDDFITNLSARTGIRVPKGVEIAISKTDRATGDIYELAVEAYNRYMSHALLCPNLLGVTGNQGGGSGGSGSYALGKQQASTFLWTVEKMNNDTSEIIVRDQLISRLLNINFPNVDNRLFPSFKYSGFDEDSIEKRATIIKMLGDGGFVNPEEEWVREFLTLPKKEPNIVLRKPSLYPGFSPNGGASEEPKPKPIEEPVKIQASKFQERRPNKFEEKLRIKEFASKLDALESQLFDALAPEIQKIEDELISYVERKKVIQSGDHRALRDMNVNVGGFKKTIEQWLVKAFLDSKLRALEELGRAGVEVMVTKKFADSDPTFSLENWKPLPPQDAINFFNRKVIASIGAVDLTLAQKKQISYYSTKAFAISGVVRDDILNDAKLVLLNAIRRNDVPGGMSDLKDLFSRYIESGIEVDGNLLAPHRLSTIVRTNMMEAINQGRRSMYEDPDVNGFVPFFQYSAIIDNRTTDYCLCMDGKNFRLDEIGILAPPSHFNCRSISVPITQPEVTDMIDQGSGVEIAQPCPDRMVAFADIKRDPVDIPAKEPSDISGALNQIPTLAPSPPEQPSLDSQPAPKSVGTLEAEQTLMNELRQIIVRCPYSRCRSTKIEMTGYRMNIGEFSCGACRLPFRVSSKGDLYLYDAGIEKWERASTGLMPAYFSEFIRKFKDKNG